MGPADTAATANLPIVKNASFDASDEIVKLRDYRNLTTNNLQNNVLRFFPPNPTNRDSVVRNYEDNPLPRNTRKRILALGFNFNKIVQPTRASINPVSLENAISHAEVRYQDDQGRKTKIEQHLKRWMNAGYLQTKHEAFDDGTDANSTDYLCLPSMPLYRVADPSDLVIGPDERFELEIEFDDTTGIPAAADYTNILQIGAYLQVNRDPM
jgi:hypothetical protein